MQPTIGEIIARTFNIEGRNEFNVMDDIKQEGEELIGPLIEESQRWVNLIGNV